MKNGVKLFSKTSSFESSRFGETDPSLEERMELTAELVVDWNVTLLVAGVCGVCGLVFEVLMFELLCRWKCAAFAVFLRSNLVVWRFKAESKLE